MPSSPRISRSEGRDIVTSLHEIARDLQDELDLLPAGSVGAERLGALRTSIIMDVCIPLAVRYPLGREQAVDDAE